MDLVIYIVAFVVANLSLTYLMTWISVRTGYSLVPIVLIHFCFNAGSTLVGMTGLGLVPDFPYVTTMACLTLLFTVVVHWISIDGKGILEFLRQALGKTRISKSIGKKFKTVNKHSAISISLKNYPGCDWRSDNENTTHS